MARQRDVHGEVAGGERRKGREEKGEEREKDREGDEREEIRERKKREKLRLSLVENARYAAKRKRQ